MNSKTKETRESGSSLVEVMIALLLLLILMTGILQMFSMSLLINQSSAARTELTYKAQQVTEILRMSQTLPTVPPEAALSPGTVQLPTNSTQDGTLWYFWGPYGMGVMEAENGPLQVSYTTVDTINGVAVGWGTGEHFRVTVTAEPNDDLTAQRYTGAGIGAKRVEYVSYITH